MSLIRVSHLDDDPFVLEKFATALSHANLEIFFETQSFSSPDELLSSLKSPLPPDIVILDVNLEGESIEGAELVRQVRQRAADALIIMCSGLSDVSIVAECLRSGADDFISKRVAMEEIPSRLWASYRAIHPSMQKKLQKVKGEIIPVGKTMQNIALRVPRIIGSAISSVHISGESGTGKEVVASLFESQLDKSTPFVRVNCGAISPSLLESELFGHVKGAFTGATADKIGLIESAHGGWIFLDEVATLSESAQVALLRVLENHAVRRVGSSQERKVNVRVISATNESLISKIKEGKFRSDLWQRLCETEIALTPLRNRAGEIPDIVHHFCLTMEGGPYKVAPTTMDILKSYSWREGNIRELRNCLRAMTEFATGQTLTPLSVPKRIWDGIENDCKSPETFISNSLENQSEGQIEIRVGLDLEAPESFDALSGRLLAQLIRIHYEAHGTMSLRSLSKYTGIPRSTLSTKVRELVDKEIISPHDLGTFLGNMPIAQ